MKPKIIWEKWRDPFGKDMDELKWTDYEDDLQPFYTGESEDAESTGIHIPDGPIKVIASPLGLIPYTEYTAPGKIFNFWLGHTNFNITQSVKTILENIEGIEILDVFTRYRFRIAIGKCFNDSEVMSDINKAIQKLSK